MTRSPYRTKLMVMENNIQKARDVLKKWREAAPWLGGQVDGGTPLIDGTAGNPDLLDELDAMFRDSLEDVEVGNGRNPRAERFATHIIAADERMSQ